MKIGYLENVKLYTGCLYRPIIVKGDKLRQTRYKTHKKYRSFIKALSRVCNEQKFYIEIINPDASGIVPEKYMYGLTFLEYAAEMRKYAKKRIIHGGNIKGIINIYGESYELNFFDENEDICDSDVSIDYGYLYGNKNFKEDDILIDISGDRDKMIVRKDFSDINHLNKIMSSQSDLHYIFISPAIDEYNCNTGEYEFDITGIIPVANLEKADE